MPEALQAIEQRSRRAERSGGEGSESFSSCPVVSGPMTSEVSSSTSRDVVKTVVIQYG